MAELKSALAKGGDVPADVRDAAATDEALKPFLAAQEAQDKGERVDLAALHAKLTDFAAKHPAAAGGEMLLFYYTTMLEEQEPTSQEIADTILGHAIRLDNNRPNDDMSVVVLRTVPKEFDPIRRMSVRLPVERTYDQ